MKVFFNRHFPVLREAISKGDKGRNPSVDAGRVQYRRHAAPCRIRRLIWHIDGKHNMRNNL